STKDKSEIKILDIGSGVAFPPIPYALLTEDNSVGIFEPIQKRVDFVNLVKQELTLHKVNMYKQRAEEFSQKNIYDVVVARAVGSVKTMLMAAFHLVALKGE
ncbi:RsmG family class I SAM-dependent methyltransferase, partial [Mycoplasmopsis synoviae]